MSTNRNVGQQYYWVEYVNSAGNPFSPPLLSQVAGAYTTNTGGGLGILPMVEPAVTTTAPLPMPREVIGQDCYVDRVQLPLLSGHASTGLRVWVRLHSPVYNTTGRSDGKLSVQINGGAWIPLTNANSSVVPVDEMKYFNRATPSVDGAIESIGGYPPSARLHDCDSERHGGRE